MKVFKKSNGNLTDVGSGTIPVNKVFQDFFSTMFPKQSSSFIGVLAAPSKSSATSAQATTLSKEIQPAPSTHSSLQTPASNSKSSSATGVQSSADPIAQIVPDPVDEENQVPSDEPVAENPDPQNAETPDPLNAESPDPPNAETPDPPNAEISDPLNAETIDEHRPDHVAVATDSSERLAGGGSVRQTSELPVSKTTKALYPLFMDEARVGVVCLLIRFTCLGTKIVSSFQLSQHNDSMMVKDSDKGKSDDDVYRLAKYPRPGSDGKNACGCGKKVVVPCDQIFSPFVVKCGGRQISIRKNVRAEPPTRPNRVGSQKRNEQPPACDPATGNSKIFSFCSFFFYNVSSVNRKVLYVRFLRFFAYIDLDDLPKCM